MLRQCRMQKASIGLEVHDHHGRPAVPLKYEQVAAFQPCLEPPEPLTVRSGLHLGPVRSCYQDVA